MKYLKLFEELENIDFDFDEEFIDDDQEVGNPDNYQIINLGADNKYPIEKIKKIVRRHSKRLNNDFHIDHHNYALHRLFSYIWGSWEDYKGFGDFIVVNFFCTKNKNSTLVYSIKIDDNRNYSFKMIKHKLSLDNHLDYEDYTTRLEFQNYENAIAFLNECGIDTDVIENQN